jgi:imidazole glycerol phosphate synthase subunit HisF
MSSPWSTKDLSLSQICADAVGDVNDLERISRSFGSQCSIYSSWSTKRVVDTSKLALCSADEVRKMAHLHLNP